MRVSQAIKRSEYPNIASFMRAYTNWFLKIMVMTAVLVTLSAVCGPQTEAADNKTPIKIGVLQSLSGSLAPMGPFGVNGARLAAEGATILGRPVELVVEDDRTDPRTGAQKARKLINVDKVVAIEGMVGSAVGIAVSMVCAEEKMPMILAGPSASELTGSKCQKSTFRVKPPNRPMVYSVAPYVIKNVGKRWYIIAYDYSWGTESAGDAKKILKDMGGEVLGEDLVPMGTQDFSSYLLKARDSKADVVFFVLGGNDAAALIKQFDDFKLGKQATLTGAVMDTAVAWQVGKSLSGIYPVPFYHKQPGAEAFVKKYVDRYGAPPDNQAWQDYVAINSLVKAINKAGSTDYAKVVKALEGLELNVEKDRPGVYRDFDHQLTLQRYIVK